MLIQVLKEGLLELLLLEKLKNVRLRVRNREWGGGGDWCLCSLSLKHFASFTALISY